MAVCGYCQSTLVRHDVNIEDIGKMAALAEDASPIRRGMAGRYKGRAFSVIGRIQQQYEAGYWNEWYLLFDDQREGWLSEGSGQFYLTFAADNPEIIPPFSQIKVGMNLKLGVASFSPSPIWKTPAAWPAKASCRFRLAPASRRRPSTCATTKPLPASTTATSRHACIWAKRSSCRA
jgi:hypothetical protein